MKEPVGVLHLVEPFRALTDDRPVVPDGYRASLEVLRPHSLGETLRVAAAIEREGARIVHATGPRANPVAVAAARLVRARVVCGLSGPVRTVAEALACRVADAVVAPSQALRPRSGRVYVVYPAVDPSRFASAPAAEPAIAVIGALRPGTGLLDLIEAIALVRQRLREVRLLCAGEGPLRPAIEQQLRFHGLRQSVELLGHVDDVAPVLARAQVACHPRHDGAPSRALIESMAAALPAVTTCAELGDPELVVAARSPALLAARLLWLLENPKQARSLGAAARRRVERELSVDAARTQLARVYAAALTVPDDRATPPPSPDHPGSAASENRGH